LFGFRSDLPARVHQSLVTEKNSLRAQSVEHQDGWGIASYDTGTPEVAHGLGPAHCDPEFERVSGLLSSHAVIAHVRKASVGRVHLDNAHPFLHRTWAFAHNGTIADFCEHREALEAEIEPAFRELLRGETDSERCFYIFMTRLRALAPAGDPDAPALARALAETMRVVASLTDRAELQSSMNFIATDGRLMAATRRLRTLFVSTRAPSNGARLGQLLIASEELTGEDQWYPVPEESVVAIDRQMVFHIWRLSELIPSLPTA